MFWVYFDIFIVIYTQNNTTVACFHIWMVILIRLDIQWQYNDCTGVTCFILCITAGHFQTCTFFFFSIFYKISLQKLETWVKYSITVSIIVVEVSSLYQLIFRQFLNRWKSVAASINSNLTAKVLLWRKGNGLKHVKTLAWPWQKAVDILDYILFWIEGTLNSRSTENTCHRLAWS